MKDRQIFQRTGVPRLKVGVLATSDSILAGRIIKSMLDLGVMIDALLLDPTPIPDRDYEIHRRRTGDALPPVPVPSGIHVSGHNAPDCLAACEGLDMLVNAGTPRICSSALLHATPIGILNCHPGWLPHYRGACAVEHAVLNGDPVCNTVHLMTEGIDEGPILTIEQVPKADSYQELRVVVYNAGFVLLAKTIARLQRGEPIEFVVQGEGAFYRPVTVEQMLEVERLIASGEYDAKLRRKAVAEIEPRHRNLLLD